MSKLKTTKKTHRLSFSVTGGLYKHIGNRAAFYGISIQEYIRQLVTADVNKWSQSGTESTFPVTKKEALEIERAENQQDNVKYKMIINQRDIEELLDNPDFETFRDNPND